MAHGPGCVAALECGDETGNAHCATRAKLDWIRGCSSRPRLVLRRRKPSLRTGGSCKLDHNYSVPMSSESSVVKALADLLSLLKHNSAFAREKGLEKYYERDVRYLNEALDFFRRDLESATRWLRDDIRNLSQSFGSYVSDQNRLDALLDSLFSALTSLPPR
jgi:hypothetical protein